MRSLPKSSPSLLAVILLLTAASSLLAQDRTRALRFEVGTSVFLPTGDYSSGATVSSRLEWAPTLNLGMVLHTGSSLALRLRGLAGLTAGSVSTIHSGPGAGRYEAPDGRVFGALSEALLAIAKPRIELGIGLGARRYQFDQGDCAGSPCLGDRSDTDLAGSLSASLGTRLRRVEVGLEAGTLISSYRGRALFDLLFGVRLRL